MLGEMLENVRICAPVIHNITNYVTANDCANILLACGASPFMSDDPEEAAEITTLCSGLNINIGTLNQRTVSAMLLAGKKANLLGNPVVLDPVGYGASDLRSKTVIKLLNEIQFKVIRGNISEIKALALGTGSIKGVDANLSDCVTQETLEQSISLAKSFSKRTGAVIAVTGGVDIVANSEKAYCINNGHPLMSKVTGTGCQLSALIAAYITANPQNELDAAAAAVCAMGLCGEKARKRMTALDGNGSYRNYVIDAVFSLTAEALERGAKYEMR